MALKIVERLPAIIALVQSLAGGRTELAQEFGIGGMALRAGWKRFWPPGVA
jgi:hypothetical protein